MRSHPLTSADWYLLYDLTKPLALKADELSQWFLDQARLERTTMVPLPPRSLPVIRTALDYATESDSYDDHFLVSCLRLERKLRSSSL